MKDFFLTIIFITAKQLGAVLGFFLIIGFALSKLQQFTQKQYYQSVGWLGILWTAWIGTPVHELSHYLMAKLFWHRIDHVSLFKPNYASGKLGEVQHSYNPRNWYQQIGNFFIGAAPLLGGVIVLLILFKTLLPNHQEIIVLANNLSWNNWTAVLWDITRVLFNVTNRGAWQFWLFLYLSFAVSSHLAPSSVDQKTMWRGLLWLIAVLLLVNAVLQLVDWSLPIVSATISLPLLIWAFWYALVVSLTHAIFSYLALRLFRH